MYREPAELRLARYDIRPHSLNENADRAAPAKLPAIFLQRLRPNRLPEGVEKEWAYPNSEEWNGILDSLALKYKLEVPPRNHPRKLKAEPIEGQGIPAPGSLPITQAVPAGDDAKPAVPDDKTETLPVSAPTGESGGKPAGSVGPSEALGQAPGPAPQPHPPGVVIGFKYCRNCGNRLPESTRFCDRCGMSTVYSEG